MRCLAAILTAALGFVACSTAPAPTPAPQVSSDGTTPTAASFPQIASGPPLVTVRQFFANAETRFGYRVSPDGTRLGWIGSHAGRSTVHVATLAGDDVRAINTHSRRNIRAFTWARDSRRVLYLLDDGGDENFHVHVVQRPAGRASARSDAHGGNAPAAQRSGSRRPRLESP